MIDREYPAEAHFRAARRVAFAHLRPWPVTFDWMLDRLRDVAFALDLPDWRTEIWTDPDGRSWASVGWKRPDETENIVRASYGRTTPSRLYALAAALAVDARPWEPLGKNDPLGPGDEVNRECDGVTTTAVVGRVNKCGDPRTAGGSYIGNRHLGTWYARRALLPTHTDLDLPGLSHWPRSAHVWRSRAEEDARPGSAAWAVTVQDTPTPDPGEKARQLGPFTTWAEAMDAALTEARYIVERPARPAPATPGRVAELRATAFADPTDPQEVCS